VSQNLSDRVRRFIVNAIGGYDEITPLEGDASVREYHRIRFENKSYILCYDEALRAIPVNEYPFYIVYHLFHQEGIPVPRIYALDDEGFLIVQDVGDDLLEHLFDRISGERKEELYRDLIEIIVRIQMIEGDPGAIPFTLRFDVEKLMYEFDFFIQHALLSYFQSNIGDGDLQRLRGEFERIAVLLDQPEYFVLNHRDFHSRNIMLYEGKPYIIDYQDARMGLVQYDLVSLLRDSYVVLDAALVQRLKQLHHALLRDSGYRKMDFDQFEFYFDIMAFQRNIKAVGTFGYQAAALGRKRYEHYIPQTLGYLHEYAERRSELAVAYEILREYIEGAW
jgi:aminoglycoside/choline kinase family phosphotransferase